MQTQIKYDKNKNNNNKKEGERVVTSVKDVNLVGLTVIFAVTTEDIDKSATSNGVAGVTPPLPWPSSVALRRLHLNLFPPHSR